MNRKKVLIYGPVSGSGWGPRTWVITAMASFLDSLSFFCTMGSLSQPSSTSGNGRSFSDISPQKAISERELILKCCRVSKKYQNHTKFAMSRFHEFHGIFTLIWCIFTLISRIFTVHDIARPCKDCSWIWQSMSPKHFSMSAGRAFLEFTATPSCRNTQATSYMCFRSSLFRMLA